ncbi:Speckle-type POZ protein [Araneus ventricosus]|uniref:Speckle-type POZ protein n=1 Tax=Araneus ventricosus TaxID=182803 RepID=A0A4Y2HMM2_ARAVE|nr:Speckle-type POZ protein [Araneus ventricosus]
MHSAVDVSTSEKKNSLGEESFLLVACNQVNTNMENEGQMSCLSVKSESPSEESFTIVWVIKNSHYFYQAGHKLQSPVVFVDVMERTGWRLVLSRLPSRKWIYATVKREAEDDGPEQFDLHYEIEIISIEERELKNKPRSHAFRKGESAPIILLCKDGKNTCRRFQPQNTTIRCIMKKNKGPIQMSGQCVARTRIGGECFQFIGEVENFRALTAGAKRTLKVLSSFPDERLMTVVLRLESEGGSEFVIDIIPVVEKSQYRYIFSYTILEYTGNKPNFQRCCEYTLQKAETFRLHETKADLERYLPNDTLSLLCKIILRTGIKYEKIGKIEYKTVSGEDVNQKVCSSPDLDTSVPAGASSISHEYDPKFRSQCQNASSVASQRSDNLNNPFPNALEDITSFYKKGILCDAKLQTATETFPAHKTILSARSPVFEAMFTSNMKEKIEECVRIDDLDAETVKRMLLFLYSDSLEELKWEDAKKLYFAADKYQVLSLRHRCAVILKKSIDLSNCCELLLLADMHQDEDLKAAVQNYIEKHDKEVFLSDRWRDMEKSHPHLAIDIFRAVHIKSS